MNTAETRVLIGILRLRLPIAQNEDYGSQGTLTDIAQQLQGDFSVDGHCVVVNQVVERAELLKIPSPSRHTSKRMLKQDDNHNSYAHHQFHHQHLGALLDN